MNRARTLISVLLAPAFFAGCAFGPDYSRPAVSVPAAWKEADPAPAAARTATLPPAWWLIFDDAELNLIQDQVVLANQDVQRALARVTEARALARLSEADRSPTLTGSSGYSRDRLSENRNVAPGPKLETSDYRTGFDLSYEIDLWGRVRRSNEAARAEAFAVESELEAVLLSLTADAARSYFQLHALDAEKRVIEATLALRRDTVGLQETRYQAGLINELDVTRARTEVANVEAELHGVTRSRLRLEHALAVLCGRPPADFAVAARAALPASPAVPAGLPSSLLARRPDIVAAEQALQAAHARIAVARADFFPRLSLTGSAGLASADLSSLVTGDSRTWSFGPRLHLPLFDGGRNRANLTVAEARYQQSAAVYRSTVLNAFLEVEDTLSDLGTLASQGEAVNRGLSSARDTAALAMERYQRGLSSFLDVVDAQRGVFQAERQSVQIRSQQIASTIHLAKAVGGGWERREALVAR